MTGAGGCDILPGGWSCKVGEASGWVGAARWVKLQGGWGFKVSGVTRFLLL